MTTILPAGAEFPGDELANRIGADAWERRLGSDLNLLPRVPDDEARRCPSNGWARAGFRREWCCTAHTPGWHRARLASGQIIAVWPDPTADAAARVARPRADEGEAS